MVPKEYYDPTILKEDVYVPCLAGDQNGEILPLCAHYTYPELYGQNQIMSTESKIPGRSDVPYGVQGREELLGELQTRKLTTVANYQPKVRINRTSDCTLLMIIMLLDLSHYLTNLFTSFLASISIASERTKQRARHCCRLLYT